MDFPIQGLVFQKYRIAKIRIFGLKSRHISFSGQYFDVHELSGDERKTPRLVRDEGDDPILNTFCSCARPVTDMLPLVTELYKFAFYKSVYLLLLVFGIKHMYVGTGIQSKTKVRP